jgi:myo-inositol-1(or 4)-monophosphatase
MLSTIVDLAREAGALLRSGLEQPRELSFKSRADLVTNIDLASERLIVTALREHFPDHAVLAEEGGGERKADGYLWLVDPVDGTTNYAHGYPVFSVAMALLDHGELALGVVYDPLRDECFTAERGRGAWLNGKPMRVSTTPVLREALLSTGFPYHRFTNPATNIPQFNAMIMQCQGIVRSGSAALDFAYVAAGRSDAHWELGLQPWDSAAGALLVREAGGRASDWQGHPYSPWNGSVIASNGLLHDQIAGVLAASMDAS